MATLIDGKNYKEILCQNPDCLRALFLYRRESEKPGVIIRITCQKCGLLNIWRFGYSELEEQFDTIKSIVEKGGEN